MMINLFDIPEEGRQFQLNNKTGELNEVLSDLIGNNLHSAQVFIRPLNPRDFEVTGSIETKTNEDCARCGLDIKFPISEKVHGLLIPPQPLDRQGKYAKVNHISESEDGGPDVNEYNAQGFFDMGEYLHEIVALAVPFNPAPLEDKEGKCIGCNLKVADLVLNYDEEMPESEKTNPFASLKNLKLQ